MYMPLPKALKAPLGTHLRSASERHSRCMRRARRNYSVMIRSAHSTIETNIAGLPNFAPH
jgi:hypothetical protein